MINPTATIYPPAEKISAGEWSPRTKPVSVDRGNGIISTVIEIGSHNAASTDAAARVAVYPINDSLDRDVADAAASGTRVTVLKVGTDMYGGSFPVIYQGRVFLGGSGEYGILPGRKTRNGYKLSGTLDLIPDATTGAVAELTRRWYCETSLPSTTKLTREALNAATEDNPIAVIWTHPGFGSGAVPGCVWYINRVEDEIANVATMNISDDVEWS
jgi:hypothetical protein